MSRKPSVYAQIIEDVFFRYFNNNKDFEFTRDCLTESAKRLNVNPPKNLGDVIYAFRYRKALPEKILATQPEGKHWLILGAGDAKYRFRLSSLSVILPRPGLIVRKIPDSTPSIIEKYSLSDEQALLARIRYNRLIDTFLGITAYSLQNHLRTKIQNYGQIEIDELYTGIDARLSLIHI